MLISSAYLLLAGLFYLVPTVLWTGYYLRVVDPRLRRWLGGRLGVTLGTQRGLWTVLEPGQGLRGCLIELLQLLFLIPVFIFPLLCLGVPLFLVLNQLPGP
ncbi:MAG: hypothetical protein L0322_18415 [Chloroflexi bacterium]|nr:hypothetical protein [Chloroflexota bacterium]